MEDITYPIRINRYLYLTGISSRRKADALIKNGDVFINGKRAELGAQVAEGDSVTLSKHAKKLSDSYQYFAYYKPRGVVSHNPQEGERSIEDETNLPKGFAPLGRLDKESEGLMILTNDGRIVDRVLNPKFGHKRTYRVTVNKKISNWFLRHMEEGVDIEGYITKPAVVKKVSDTSFEIALTEGKKHQIRRMVAALKAQVVELRRISFGPITIQGMKKGELRELDPEERTKLLALAGI